MIYYTRGRGLPKSHYYKGVGKIEGNFTRKQEHGVQPKSKAEEKYAPDAKSKSEASADQRRI